MVCIVFATAWLWAAGPARAVVLDDLLSRGYTVAATTTLPGLFSGCVRAHRLAFADGSSVACARTAAQTGYDLRVQILRLRDGAPSIVLIGSQIIAGQLLRLGLHNYPVALRLDAAPLGSRSAAASLGLRSIGPMPRIGAVAAVLPASAAPFRSLPPGRVSSGRPRR